MTQKVRTNSPPVRESSKKAIEQLISEERELCLVDATTSCTHSA